MLSNRTRPLVINKLPDPLASPKCSLELRILSPRCLENPNPVAGVGLAIVAALEKSSPSPGTSVKSIPIPIYGGSKCKYNDQDEDDGGCGDMSFKNSSGVFSYESQPKMNPNMVLPPLDFLNSCGLCRKKLHGVDIYMYRGEKAFCSKECRCRQMMIDEHREKCGSELSKSSVDMSTSPYSRDNIFFTGIIVA